ncbi:16S rRNA (guanine(966)-N(2))-methyltransferase RsmD [Candidatus Pantoea edessiphila]|uniref:Ribosomal RNA small subunit methyltransferase D n=1 Tax=Candidatus Pantoea edessiphila TaxID=2044610 RepID=A0A2P5SVV3_9GAMM|nr:16S rRNA (guanine(966)-N(2))-methyltransferase RsmD [Candidatus Pantoea edessiphila]PPI86468.1 16S rRNA (guanine(966)-N(2))-methyltransferase RsmD [Candidatus Pantoea edessiphila]
MKKFYNNYYSGYIRIIGGKFRGYKLPVLNLKGLHPTSDRIRETLFNWLNPILEQSNCLDCFSGSGALGFEAISRYASYVIMLESNINAVKQLEKNLKNLKIFNGKIIKTNTLSWLKQRGKPFDVVFVDPPFDDNLVNKTVWLLNTFGWLNDDSLIYIENKIDIMIADIPINWKLYRRKTAGKVSFSLYHLNQ